MEILQDIGSNSYHGIWFSWSMGNFYWSQLTGINLNSCFLQQLFNFFFFALSFMAMNSITENSSTSIKYVARFRHMLTFLGFKRNSFWLNVEKGFRCQLLDWKWSWSFQTDFRNGSIWTRIRFKQPSWQRFLRSCKSTDLCRAVSILINNKTYCRHNSCNKNILHRYTREAGIWGYNEVRLWQEPPNRKNSFL